MKQIILLSDTHHTLDERFFSHFETADEIWHAGDIGDLSVTDKLKTFAPIRAVWGNIDNKTIRTEFKGNLYFKCEFLTNCHHLSIIYIYLLLILKKVMKNFFLKNVIIVILSLLSNIYTCFTHLKFFLFFLNILLI